MHQQINDQYNGYDEYFHSSKQINGIPVCHIQVVHNSCSNVQFIAIFSLSKWLGGGLEAEFKKNRGYSKVVFR